MTSPIDAVRALGSFSDASEREAMLAWMEREEGELNQLVARCPRVRWLAVLADLFDQRIVWWLFQEEIDDTVPERAEANRRLAAGERPEGTLSEDELFALGDEVASGDPVRKAAAIAALGENYERVAVSELGYAAGLHASEAMLDAAIETLRARLDVTRMQRALSALVLPETAEMRAARYRRDAVADKAELEALDDPNLIAGAWGAASGRERRNVPRALRSR